MCIRDSINAEYGSPNSMPRTTVDDPLALLEDLPTLEAVRSYSGFPPLSRFVGEQHCVANLVIATLDAASRARLSRVDRMLRHGVNRARATRECRQSYRLSVSTQSSMSTHLKERKLHVDGHPRGRVSLSFERTGFSCDTVGRWLCITGGSDLCLQQSNQVAVLDLKEFSWSHSEMLEGRAFHSSTALNDKLYTVGGQSSSFRALNTVEWCDPTTRQHGTVAELPGARYHHTCMAFNDKLYVVGGQDDGRFICLNLVAVYDDELDVWSVGPPLCCARRGHQCIIQNDSLCVVGGFDSCSRPVVFAERLDSEGKAWSVIEDQEEAEELRLWAKVEADRYSCEFEEKPHSLYQYS
eukprot:TRINITY_DN20885_c0_g1_i1.p1 TRINITY_DN20885_c0_g1~~TRINITY_DN20885_c0_g1_i1.p1  ORF type:complete len:353 (+),score=61.10 TRINITY_DN20885_c0_g1_i1:136-1194(+)